MASYPDKNIPFSSVKLLLSISRNIILPSLILILLSSCVSLIDPESSQEINSKIIGTIEPGNHVGQTFISRRPRFNGLKLWLSPDLDFESSQCCKKQAYDMIM